jgi:hypothetical protein
MIQDAAEGAPHTNDYTAEAWKDFSPKQKQIQADLNRLGDFVSMTLVDRSEENGRRTYRYRLEFANATVLQRFVLDKQNKLADGGSEASEVKPGATIPEVPGAPVVGIGVALRVDG